MHPAPNSHNQPVENVLPSRARLLPDRVRRRPRPAQISETLRLERSQETVEHLSSGHRGVSV
jgi:hypothetical protein